jgi:hypothetical protein
VDEGGLFSAIEGAGFNPSRIGCREPLRNLAKQYSRNELTARRAVSVHGTAPDESQNQPSVSQRDVQA